MTNRNISRILRHTGLLAVLFAILPAAVWANEKEALRVAVEFWQGKNVKLRRGVAELHTERKTGNGYVFTPASGNGFIWVEEAEETPRVCGYSLTSDVRGTALPALLSSLTGRGGWRAHPSGHTEPVAPLLTSVWNQTPPYNGMCPYYRFDDGTWSEQRCKVGCVATAVSEVMRYYAYPEILLDTLHGWATPHYELEDVLPGFRFDWSHMLDRYDGAYSGQEARAVQELALCCGMAARMNYGLNASGSNAYRLLAPLHRAFGYEYVAFYDRARYSPSVWRALLQYELRRGIPLVYVGFNMQLSGHAFVVDGLDESGFWHVRWGEGGLYDGYFDIDMLNAYENPADPTELGREIGLFCNQMALAFHPHVHDMYSGDTLTYEASDVTVEQVDFRRSPDTNEYVTADVRLHNRSGDTITYTLLAFTADSLADVDMQKTETAGITAVTLYPGQHVEVPVHCRFVRHGSRCFGLTGDGEHILYLKQVEVEKGGPRRLLIGPAEVLELTSGHVTLVLPVTNEAETGWAGDLLTYSFYQEGMERDAAHWFLLNSAPGESVRDTVTFAGLHPQTGYSFRVRHPWEFVYTYEFRTPAASGIGHVAAAEDDEVTLYTLQGIRVGSAREAALPVVLRNLPGGIYLAVSRDGMVRKFSND